jgi:alkylated DNA repair dioxygenase AlkB
MPEMITDASGCSPEVLDLPDAEILFYPTFFSAPEANRLLSELRETTEWRQDTMPIFGKQVSLPRLTAWYGDPGCRYVYSGIENEPLPWTAVLHKVKRAVELPSGVVFNGVLLNRYRDGRDSMGWHSDNEPEFGDEPVIASASFGGTRTFQMKHKKRQDLKASLELTHGSLLIMRGRTQANWLHQIPKTAKPVQERLNLTFRLVVCRAR